MFCCGWWGLTLFSAIKGLFFWALLAALFLFPSGRDESRATKIEQTPFSCTGDSKPPKIQGFEANGSDKIMQKCCTFGHNCQFCVVCSAFGPRPDWGGEVIWTMRIWCKFVCIYVPKFLGMVYRYTIIFHRAPILVGFFLLNVSPMGMGHKWPARFPGKRSYIKAAP